VGETDVVSTGTGPTQRTGTLSTTVFGAAFYAYIPFDMPPGVCRVDVRRERLPRPAWVGIGLFDARGSAFQSPGFRGVSGVERSEFFVAADAASVGFLPGPMDAGTWTLILPVFGAPLPVRVSVTVTLTFGPAPAAPYQPGPLPGVVLDVPGWYRTDLHCHGPASSDAYASGSALDPAGWARACRRIGLDAVALTDHNVVSQNLDLARAAGDDVLLLAGEEMTDWFHGHATVSGLEPMQWLDWRLSPFGLPWPQRGGRVREFLRLADEMGAYVAVAHPFRPGSGWQFFAEAASLPAARAGGLEVWNGVWSSDDELALFTWDRMLRRGWAIWANGGSDLHGEINTAGRAAGTPTTVVYADALAKDQIVRALRAGRSFVTGAPDGVEIYLTARSADGRQAAYVGGTIWGARGDDVTVEARVRGGDGHRLRLVGTGGLLLDRGVEGDDETISLTTSIPLRHGYIRAEVRPDVARRQMKAFTNPILLRVGERPAGEQALQYAPPPPLPGPRRRIG
jgi:hypothetical protein